jgi:hypothetical protein
MPKLIITSFLLLLSFHLFSQREYAVEYQHGFGKSYNSNSIAAGMERFNNGDGSWLVAINYSFDVFVSDKKTSGISGFGFSLGYRHGFTYDVQQNFLGGIRTTVSFLSEPGHVKLTPSIEFGYHYTFNPSFESGAFITPSVAFGYDIPVGNEKEGDYKGKLFIPRLSIGYRY